MIVGILENYIIIEHVIISMEKLIKRFISQMVLDKLDEANDEEEADTLLDATYYILHHLSGTGLDIRPIWNLIHNANMKSLDKVGIITK